MTRTPSLVEGWHGMIDDSTRFTSHNGREPRFGAQLSLEEAVSDLLPLMPPLFDTDLPPYDPISQKAYENVVWRLRIAWMQKARYGLIPMHLGSIQHMCALVLRELESIRWSDNELFKQQLYWAAYLVREAESLHERVFLSQRDREWQETILEYTYPVPKELYIRVERCPENRMLLREWRAWQRKKRRPMPMLDQGMQQKLIRFLKVKNRTREMVQG